MVIQFSDIATAMLVCLAVTAGSASGQQAVRKAFEPRRAKLTGSIMLSAPIHEAFPLFSPLGEKHWAEGWDPEIVSPAGGEWTRDMVFRTRDADQEVIWIVAELDLEAHRVAYFRTVPDLLVARVEVRCRAMGDRTEATVGYSYVGLSDAGNAQIAEWTEAAYRLKMEQWEKAINDYLARARQATAKSN